MTAYSLYFLGGRYPILGDLLDRSMPAFPYAPIYPMPSTPYPVPPSPAP
jgi:hypothetical protein